MKKAIVWMLLAGLMFSPAFCGQGLAAEAPTDDFVYLRRHFYDGQPRFRELAGAR